VIFISQLWDLTSLCNTYWCCFCSLYHVHTQIHTHTHTHTHTHNKSICCFKRLLTDFEHTPPHIIYIIVKWATWLECLGTALTPSTLYFCIYLSHLLYLYTVLCTFHSCCLNHIYINLQFRFDNNILHAISLCKFLNSAQTSNPLKPKRLNSRQVNSIRSAESYQQQVTSETEYLFCHGKLDLIK